MDDEETEETGPYMVVRFIKAWNDESYEFNVSHTDASQLTLHTIALANLDYIQAAGPNRWNRYRLVRRKPLTNFTRVLRIPQQAGELLRLQNQLIADEDRFDGRNHQRPIKIYVEKLIVDVGKNRTRNKSPRQEVETQLHKRPKTAQRSVSRKHLSQKRTGLSMKPFYIVLATIVLICCVAFIVTSGKKKSPIYLAETPTPVSLPPSPPPKKTPSTPSMSTPSMSTVLAPPQNPFGPDGPPKPDLSEFSLTNVPGDGDCFYHSLAGALYGIPATTDDLWVEQLRSDTYTCIDDHWDMYTSNKNEDTIKEWNDARDRAQNGGWAHDKEIEALSFCMKIEFRIYEEGHYAPETSPIKGWQYPIWVTIRSKYLNEPIQKIVHMYNTKKTHFQLLTVKLESADQVMAELEGIDFDLFG